jgi:PAS domain S-box-containing protein
MANDVSILVVDDRPADLLAIESVLAPASYRLVRATSGPDALRHALDEDFAVILVDVNMPGMNGLEVAQLIKQRERSRDTPIIFLSADGSNPYRGYSAGAVDYLVKPLDPDILRAKVAIFVELLRKDRRIHAQAEALRALEQQRYRNLAEAIPQIVWIASERGAITYFNRRWYEYTGQSAAEATGLGWLAAVARADADQTAAAWRAGIAAGVVFELDCRVVRGDGGVAWHLCRAVPERDGGRVIGWLGTFTDCDVLKRACETAEHAVRARDEFLSIASHELKTPVATLQLWLESMRADLAAKEVGPAARKADSCTRQIRRLVGLVESMFDLARIASGKLELNRARTDLAAVAREVVERFAELAARTNTTLAVDVVDGAVIGCWDRQRVEQIVDNLVANAIKYAPDGPIAVRVHGRGEVATIEVVDRGPGIAPDALAAIFAPFVRATSASSCGGLGLGLYIARELARAHGGSIDVASTVGAGTTFTVELPHG